jgi:hypothetical protein
MSKTPWGYLLAAMCLLACALPAVAQAAQCSNEQLRREDDSTRLPECRAYELVSPPDKNGAAVAMSQPVMSAPSGESVMYESTGVFAGAQASPLANGYVATRGASGWSTRATEAPQLNNGVILADPTQAVSEDLGKSLQASEMVLAPGAVLGQGNVYLSDNATGERVLIGTSNGRFAFREFGSTIDSTFVGGSTDYSHVTFNYPFALVPGSSEGSPNLYDWDGSTLHLVNYLPDGSVASNWSPAESYLAGQNPHTVSADGSKIFFGAEGALYVRENDTTTVPISLSQRAGAPSTPQQGVFGGASRDGSIVYFTSPEDLTEGPASPQGYAKLYRYDFSTSRLTDLTVTTAPSDAEAGASVQRIIQVSEDGSYIYFTAQGDLAPGATTAPYGITNLYVWHAGDGVRYITQANVGGQVSPNGLHLAFVTETQLTSYNCSGCAMLYDYDYASGRIRCVSCDPSGAPPMGPVEFGGLPFGTGVDNYHPKTVLDDGAIYFGSPDPLVPQDTNGQYDVYQWRDGELSLISSGTSSRESAFADTSPTGEDVYFKTGQRLVGQDTDENVDLYDARVGGGLPAPAVANPCTGTGCQGVPSAPPIFATPPSVTFTGVGNFEAATKPAVTAKPKSLTRAQKLAAALKVCHKRKPPKKRAACEASARKQYGKQATARRKQTAATKQKTPATKQTPATKSNGRSN